MADYYDEEIINVQVVISIKYKKGVPKCRTDAIEAALSLFDETAKAGGVGKHGCYGAQVLMAGSTRSAATLKVHRLARRGITELR